MTAPHTLPETDLGLCLVTGGAGFLAGHIVRELLRRGHRVRTLDLREQVDPDPRCEHLRGDLRIASDVRRACAGVDTVFHTAALVDFVGIARPERRERIVSLNVGGTRNVIETCVAERVSRLVYTSSNNVLLGTPIEGATGASPYPDHHVDLYSETKTRAERDVLAANGRGGLATCALRPGGIYGIGDPFYLPELISKCARGLLIADVGDGRSMADNTFVGNLVHGELLAAAHLRLDSPMAGRAYYITDGEPTPPLEFFRPIIEGLGYRMPSLRLPFRAMYSLGYAWEALHRYHLAPEPQITRLHCMKAAISHSGSIEEATRDFGYTPIHDWRRELDATVPYCRDVLARMRDGTWPTKATA